MQAPLDWLRQNDQKLVDDLARLVAVQSISTDGEHKNELNQSAELTCELMQAASLDKVEVLNDRRLVPVRLRRMAQLAPGKPTVFLYAHHDVQPVNFEEGWEVPRLATHRARLADSMAGAPRTTKGRSSPSSERSRRTLKTVDKLPCNVKMLVEGEEEIGSAISTASSWSTRTS